MPRRRGLGVAGVGTLDRNAATGNPRPFTLAAVAVTSGRMHAEPGRADVVGPGRARRPVAARQCAWRRWPVGRRIPVGLARGGRSRRRGTHLGDLERETRGGLGAPTRRPCARARGSGRDQPVPWAASVRRGGRRSLSRSGQGRERSRRSRRRVSVRDGGRSVGVGEELARSRRYWCLACRVRASSPSRWSPATIHWVLSARRSARSRVSPMSMGSTGSSPSINSSLRRVDSGGSSSWWISSRSVGHGHRPTPVMPSSRSVVDAIGDESVDIRFVLTIRADLLDGPLGHPRLGSLVGRGTYLVVPMSPAELDEAIVLPAAHAGVHVDDAVAAELVADAARRPGSLPLLQFALTELYDRRVDAVIGPEALDAIGGVAGAIGRRAEELYLDGDDGERSATRDLFVRLVAPGDGSPDTRRRAPLGELSDQMRKVADRFVESRLLVTDRDPTTREPTVRGGSRGVAGTMAPTRRMGRRGSSVAQPAPTPVRGRPCVGRRRQTGLRAVPGCPTRGSDRSHRARRARRLRPRTRVRRRRPRGGCDADVVAARRTARRLRRRLTALAVALVLALVAGAVAVLQRSDALDAADRSAASDRSARIEALVGRVESLRSTQRDVAALLAVEAYQLADTPRTRSSLFGTFTDDERFLDAHRLAGDRGTSGIVLPDGSSAFVTGQDGVLRPYDLETGRLGDALPGDRQRRPLPGARGRT